MSEATATTTVEPADLWTNILTPGSSLNPQFLLIVDATLAFLLCIFIGLFALTRSLHAVALMGIELCLWASVKWYALEHSCIVH